MVAAGLPAFWAGCFLAGAFLAGAFFAAGAFLAAAFVFDEETFRMAFFKVAPRAMALAIASSLDVSGGGRFFIDPLFLAGGFATGAIETVFMVDMFGLKDLATRGACTPARAAARAASPLVSADLAAFFLAAGAALVLLVAAGGALAGGALAAGAFAAGAALAFFTIVTLSRACAINRGRSVGTLSSTRQQVRTFH